MKYVAAVPQSPERRALRRRALAVVHFGGQSEAWLRLLPLLAFMGSVALLGILGARLCSQAIGLWPRYCSPFTRSLSSTRRTPDPMPSHSSSPSCRFCCSIARSSVRRCGGGRVRPRGCRNLVLARHRDPDARRAPCARLRPPTGPLASLRARAPQRPRDRSAARRSCPLRPWVRRPLVGPFAVAAAGGENRVLACGYVDRPSPGARHSGGGIASLSPPPPSRAGDAG